MEPGGYRRSPVLLGLLGGLGVAAVLAAVNALSPCPYPCGWIGLLLGVGCITGCGSPGQTFLSDFLSVGALAGPIGLLSGVAIGSRGS